MFPQTAFTTNARMIGLLYIMGTAFGVLGTLVGGDAIVSLIQCKPMEHLVLQDLGSSNLLYSALFILMMGISLTAMAVFAYPVFKRDSETLAMGMLVFRGALEGVFYLLTTAVILGLYVLGTMYAEPAANGQLVQVLAGVLYRVQNLMGPFGTLLFLIGAACLYASFYRTRLIPRWLSIWGLVGVCPYLLYAVLHIFGRDQGVGLYLQMVLAPQEMVMAAWLIVKGFDRRALAALLE